MPHVRDIAAHNHPDRKHEDAGQQKSENKAVGNGGLIRKQIGAGDAALDHQSASITAAVGVPGMTERNQAGSVRHPLRRLLADSEAQRPLGWPFPTSPCPGKSLGLVIGLHPAMLSARARKNSAIRSDDGGAPPSWEIGLDFLSTIKSICPLALPR